MPIFAWNDDYDRQSSYKTILWVSTRLDAPTSGHVTLRAADVSQGYTAANAGQSVFYFDPAAWAVGSKTLYMRLDCTCLVNAVAPAASFTFALYPVTAVAGAAATVSITVGTVVAGSAVTFTTPAANSMTHTAGSDFAFPAAGFYAIDCNTDTNAAASSSAAVKVKLQVRAT